jgi:hypothetical protein
MANHLYKDHLLICRAFYNEARSTWIPKIFISYPVNGKYELHYFQADAQLSEIDALSLGKQLAQAWVDNKITRGFNPSSIDDV